MPAIRGITVSVGYAPVLAITLPRNMRHMTECLVVTSPEDRETQDVACSVPGVRVFETTSFYEHNAIFNKGYALELGFSELGRHGWILIWDADILFPNDMPLHLLKPGFLNGCHRRILEDPSKWSPDLDWRRLPVSRDVAAIGFFQAFMADDPAIRDKRPWYEVTFTHAGGGDAFFVEHWPTERRKALPFDVLHLGPTDTHWFGTDQAGKDMMARFVRENGWRAATRKHSQESANRAGPIVERVEVPGYEPTGFILPFVKRAQQLKNRNA